MDKLVVIQPEHVVHIEQSGRLIIQETCRPQTAVRVSDTTGRFMRNFYALTDTGRYRVIADNVTTTTYRRKTNRRRITFARHTFTRKDASFQNRGLTRQQ